METEREKYISGSRKNERGRKSECVRKDIKGEKKKKIEGEREFKR
jgi:hypothetical protein